MAKDSTRAASPLSAAKISILLAIANLAVATATSANATTAERNRTQTGADAATSTSVRTSARAGRMLDLDRLSGELGSKALPSPSGNRQSRRLATGEERSRKGGKRMSINGFIPIVSLAEGHSLSSLTGNEQDTDESESDATTANSPNHLREQLANNYGAETSLGHASIPATPAQVEQWGQPQANFAGGRAREKKLLGAGNILSGLANKNFMANLLQPSQQLSHFGPQAYPQPPAPTSMGGPVNTLPGVFEQMNSAPNDCICVPFFQCKNGFLSESQLSRSQITQIQGQQIQAQQIGSQFQQPFNSLQTPRSLSQQGSTQVQTTSEQSASQQQLLNDIYEQLRKNMEAGAFEQQLASGLIDERHANNGSSLGAATSEAEERSLVNRRSQPSQRCGIMRTCCRLAPKLNHAARLVQPIPFVQSGTFGPVASPSVGRPQTLVPHRAIQAPSSNSLEPMDYIPQALAAGSQVGAHQMQVAGASSAPSAFMAGRCGLRQTLGISGRVQNTQAQEAGGELSADFGEFPAHAAILKRISPDDSLFVCSAVLISSQWLATAAHCVRKFRPEELKVRLGEWDVSRDDEFYPFFEAGVRELVLNPNFQPASLANDIALVRLEQIVDSAQVPHIAPACLPQASEGAAFVGQRCWVAGWGKNAFGQQGSFQSVLKKVDLPVVGHRDCEFALRHQTRLGRHFRLHASNICAGGERGKDACEGDGGAALYCAEGQGEGALVKAVGLVSWGVGCGQRGVPGVYVNLAHFGPWIEGVVAASGEENIYSDARAVVSERSAGPKQLAAANSTRATDLNPLTTNATMPA